MKIILIRHGATQGNLEGRYIGSRTDEPLCEEGIQVLQRSHYPEACRVFVSPMRRCLETAKVIYPAVPPQIVNDFRECDFGRFEGRNYAELNGREDYQAWIDSGGTLPFPGGESRLMFASRSVSAFQQLLPRMKNTNALIVHGGTIMAIMEAYARPKKDYFAYQVHNGSGFILDPETGDWTGLNQMTA
ncbi:MAG: histidine phosphatase family protein [Clostridia bacterium]|nr:histidine phosphatase family protein [Clostridia bacterium]